jgi:hypothetical protein
LASRIFLSSAAGEKLGPLKIQRWDNLHFEEAPQRPLTVLRVERVNARKTRRDPGVVWLGYCGAQPLPTQSALWREYLSRYVIEHWYRFLKQSLHWTLPQLGTPEQSELWSTLVSTASRELWLARGSAGCAASVAKAASAGKNDSGTGATGYGSGFGEDWYTDPRAQTPGKVAGLAARTGTHQTDALRRAQKDAAQGTCHGKIRDPRGI